MLKFSIYHEIYYFLISNEHTIKKDIINNNNIINLYFNGELITSNLNNKKRYIKSFIDNGYDISVIEIINEDNISKDYFLRNELETDNNRLTLLARRTESTSSDKVVTYLGFWLYKSSSKS